MEQCVAQGRAEAGPRGAYLTAIMNALQNRTSAASPGEAVALTGNRHPPIPLRSAPIVAVALAAVLVTLWLAAADLRPHSLFADPVGVPTQK